MTLTFVVSCHYLKLFISAKPLEQLRRWRCHLLPVIRHPFHTVVSIIWTCYFSRYSSNPVFIDGVSIQLKDKLILIHYFEHIIVAVNRFT
jgi:hypothetical protein